MAKSLCVIGEALIDFIPIEKNCRLKDVMGFEKAVGGAPTNVAGVVAKLGGHSKILTKLGHDAFGDYLLSSMQDLNIDVSYVKRTFDKDTSLAFVSLDAEGNRDFKFYRKTAADLDFGIEDIDLSCLDDVSVLHYCSVDLVPSKMEKAHRYLIEEAIKRNIIISFDPNLRFSLWDDLNLLKETVNDYLQYCDIVKISDEELEFICGESDIESALPKLLKNRCKVVIYTKGSAGAELITATKRIMVDSYKVSVIDTTGAGDSFIGAFLYRLINDSEIDLNNISIDIYRQYLDFASLYAAYMTTQKGCASSLATLARLEQFKQKLGL